MQLFKSSDKNHPRGALRPIGNPARFDIVGENDENISHSLNRLMVKKQYGKLRFSFWESRHPRPSFIIKFLEEADEKRPFPDFDWVRIYSADGPPRQQILDKSPQYCLLPTALDTRGSSLPKSMTNLFPLITTSMDAESCLTPNFGLYPDFSFWNYHGAYNAVGNSSGWSQFYPLSQSLTYDDAPLPSMVFRCGYSAAGTRLASIKLSEKFPHIVDSKAIPIHGEKVRLTPLEMAQRYKYLLDAGGGAYSARIKWMLCFKRLSFIREKLWPAFYEINLKPYTHYVPLKADISDLITQYDWAESHPNKCEEIIYNCREFAQTTLSPSSLSQRWHNIFATIKQLYQ